MSYPFKNIMKIVDLLKFNVNDNEMDSIYEKLISYSAKLEVDDLEHMYFLLEEDSELQLDLLSYLTVNFTSFNREKIQFTYLRDYIEQVTIDNPFKVFRIWSAACSTGEEVYTLASWLYYWKNSTKSSWDFEILGSDIDLEVLEICKNGVYRWDDICQLPKKLVDLSWVQGTEDIKDYGQVDPDLAQKCSFAKINLNELDVESPADGFDVILIRNVLIYFSEPARKQILKFMTKKIREGGLILLGASEVEFMSHLDLTNIGDAVYKRASHPDYFEYSYQFHQTVELTGSDNPFLIIRHESGKSQVYTRVNLTSKLILIEICNHVASILSSSLSALELIFCGENSHWQQLCSHRVEFLRRFSRLDHITTGKHIISTGTGSIAKESSFGMLIPLEYTDLVDIRILFLDSSLEEHNEIYVVLSECKRFGSVQRVHSWQQVADRIIRKRPDILVLNWDQLMEIEDTEFSILGLKSIPLFSIGVGLLDRDTAKKQVMESEVDDYFFVNSTAELMANQSWLTFRMEQISKRQLPRGVNHVTYHSYADIAKSFSQGLVVIGASTGGINAIEHILRLLPRAFPPIVVIIHIDHSTSINLAARLDQNFRQRVKILSDGEDIRPSTVFICPGGFSTIFNVQSSNTVANLIIEKKGQRFVPNVNKAFFSIAALNLKRVIAVVLTGMGDDGAQGLLKLKQRGAATICQSESSCEVYGMPKAAIELGAAEFVCDLESIADTLMRCVSKI